LFFICLIPTIITIDAIRLSRRRFGTAHSVIGMSVRGNSRSREAYAEKQNKIPQSDCDNEYIYFSALWYPHIKHEK